MFSEVDFSVYLYAVFAGVVIAALYAYYNKRILGKFVRKLLDDGCDRVSKAKTLDELGFKKSGLIKFVLRPNSSLSNVVISADMNTGDSAQPRKYGELKPARNFATERFYIPSDFQAKAERTYDSQGTTILSVVLTAIVFYIVLVLCYFIVPLVVDFSGSMVKSFYSDKTGGNTVLVTNDTDYILVPETTNGTGDK
ncbi:hypothetical protein SDC9_99757 [bioreactor metagenome]|uniref:Uncharacterized protein n=1 Tax=bioreactor metagenome TaxID=1076179 RepID=A0A645AQ64_9ZZZZ|nr:hypothetical protein [Oscillospiraceae bacterium]